MTGFVAGCGGGDHGASGPTAAVTAAEQPSEPARTGAPWAGSAKTLTLFGAQVVPPVQTLATATAAITLDDDVSVRVDGALLADATSVHLHRGAAGTDGPIELELLPASDDRTRWSIDNAAVPNDLREAIFDSNTYIDVHTEPHVNGELRGQVEGEFTVRFVALAGGDVVPPVATPQSGIAAITYRDICGWEWDPEIEVHVNLIGLDDATEVSIRSGAVGEKGPVLRPLTRDLDDLAHWSATVCIDENVTKHADFRGHYLSAATAARPDGTVRGQIETRNGLLHDEDVFRVVSVTPSDGSRIATPPAAISFEFNRDVDPATVTAQHMQLHASGGDGRFGNGNEMEILPVSTMLDGSRLAAYLTGLGLSDDVYNVRLDATSDAALKDTDHAPLRGNTDGVAPVADFVSTFSIDAQAPPPATLQELQDSLFTPGCAHSGCHGLANPQSHPLLIEGSTHRNLVGVRSRQSPLLNLVQPGNANRSYVVQLMQRPWVRSHPAGRPPLTNAQLQMLRSWIDAGALDN